VWENSGLAENVADDPLFIFLQKNWRFLMVLCIVFGVVYFARDVYLKNFAATMQEAADHFAVARRDYSQLVTVTSEIQKLDSKSEDFATKSAELEKQKEGVVLNLKGSLVELSNQREPYKWFAPLYGGLMKLSLGDIAGAEAELSSLKWEALPAEASADRMVAELAALNLARAKLDFEQSADQGKKLLEALARNGEFANVAAVTVLGMVAKTEADKKIATDIIVTILQNHPEQSDVLQPELDRLGEGA
jgi:predicted negative regulator of RcsB-dependent stress response